MYLNTVLQRDDSELTKQVVLCQRELNIDGDFYPQTKADMDFLSITEENVSQNNAGKLKEILTKNARASAYTYLLEKARSHSKVNDTIYTNCDGCNHYNDSRFTPDITNNLFRFRTRTFLVKNNFRNNDRNTNILCPLCEQADDTQEHIFQCQVIIEQYGRPCASQYSDIYSNNVEILFRVANELKRLVEIREKILNPDDDDAD